MYKYVLRSIEGIDIYPVISLIIFFLFFVGLLWWVYSKDKSYYHAVSTMPFEEDLKSSSKTTQPNRNHS